MKRAFPSSLKYSGDSIVYRSTKGIMKGLFVFGAILSMLCLRAFAAIPPAQAPKALSLQECIDIAIAQNPDLKSAAATVDILDARVIEAHAPLEPNLSAFYDWTHEHTPLGQPVITSTGKFQAQPETLDIYQDGLQLNQLIFDGQRDASLFHEAEAERDAQLDVYQRLIQTITFNVTQDYFQLIADRKLVDVAKENVKDNIDHLNLAKAGYRAGTQARADVIFAEVPVATARLALTQAIETEQEAQASLNRLLAFNVNTRIDAADQLEETPYPITLDAASQTALQYRFEIKQAQSLVRSAQDQLAAANGLYWPVISGFADYGYTGYNATEIFPTSLGYSYGIQATFDIFDGNLREGEVSEAKATINQNLESLEATRQNVLLDVKNAYLAFFAAKQSVDEATVEVAQANENVHLVEGQYKVGVVPILNLLDAEVEKITAEQHLIGALSSYQIAIGQLKLAMGK